MNTPLTEPNQNMKPSTDISEKFTPPAQQSAWIRREVERHMVREEYEAGYDLYLTDPTLTDPDDFDTFVANNR